MNEKFSRFIKVQEERYPIALEEIQGGKKIGHWIWYIFPRIQGFERDNMTFDYAIRDIEEATDYLNHSVLGTRLIEICSELLKLDSNDPLSIFESPDHEKLQASVTLFSQVKDANLVFVAVLEKFFDGKSHIETLDILHKQRNEKEEAP